MENSLTSSFKAAHQLVVYSGERGTGSYIEHHEIISHEGKQFLSEGKPLTKKAMKNILDIVLSGDRSVFATINKLLPANVIYYDPRPGKLKLIWWEKAQTRQLLGFTKQNPKASLPAFIYLLDDDKLSLWALRTNSRPTIKTKLFRAPVPNVYEHGGVCMGDVKKPRGKAEITDLIEAWQVAFWNSEFTDFLSDHDDAKPLRIAIRNRKPFPKSKLRPAGKTIQTIIR